jgi:Ca2+/Na+ antiporter
MIGPIRVTIIGFLILGVIYILLAIYLRSLWREKLERKWDEEVRQGDRDAYIREGMKRYDRSLRKRLLILVFVIPALVVGFMLYVVNFM